MTARRGRGRPKFVPTDRDRLKVKTMRLDGHGTERIAMVLGINVKTLEKHFREELDDGALTLRAEIMTQLAQDALDGKVASARQLEAMASIGRSRELERNAPDPEPVSEPLGKKEQRLADAEKASTNGIFAAPEGPKLIVSNG